MSPPHPAPSLPKLALPKFALPDFLLPKSSLPRPSSPKPAPVEALAPSERARRSPPCGPEVLEVVHSGRIHRVQVRRVANARRLTLRVRAATRDVVLTMPPRSSLPRARLFVERNAEWIGHRLDGLPAATPFGPGAAVPLRGMLHQIVHRPGARGVVWREADEATGSPRLCVGGDAPFVERRLRDYLRAQARADLVAAAARHAATLGVGVRRITLRDTTSRWGSCSSSHALSFSWRLVMAPPHVLDYLAAHEVAHIVHMNHSDAFWATVARLVPDFALAEAWLKANGLTLMRFGASRQS